MIPFPLLIQSSRVDIMSMLRLVFLLGLLTALLLAVGFYFAGITGMTIGLILAFVMNFASYWYSDSIVLKMYKAKEINPNDYEELKNIGKLSKKAQIPQPKMYIIDTEIPNAFATGRSPNKGAVAVTKGLLEKLDKDEVEAVISHELGHIKHRDTLLQTMTATLAGALSWLGYLFYFGDNENRNALSAVLLFIFVPLAATLIRTAVSRNREFFADRFSGTISNPLSLASALEKISGSVKGKNIKGNNNTSHLFIVNPFTAGTLVSLFSTHPPTEERVARLRSMTI
jgi:heat shock protein HtpX